MKAPNEKLTELLFTRYMLQSFPLGTVSLYAPSTREEFCKGYDAKFMGKAGCRELYLQFKTPNITKRGFTIYVTPHQHLLMRKYPHKSSYYVSHIFKSIAEIQDSQLQISKSSDFLKQYIAISASALPKNTDFIQYEQDVSTKDPRDPKYKIDLDGNIRKAQQKLENSEWLRGDKLLHRYKDNQIGGHFKFGSCNNSNYKPVRILSREQEVPERDFSLDFLDVEEESYGVMMRIYE